MAIIFAIAFAYTNTQANFDSYRIVFRVTK